MLLIFHIYISLRIIRVFPFSHFPNEINCYYPFYFFLHLSIQEMLHFFFNVPVLTPEYVLISEELEVGAMREHFLFPSNLTTLCDFIFLYSWISFHNACIPYFHHALVHFRTSSLLTFPRCYEQSRKKKTCLNKYTWHRMSSILCKFNK